MANSGISGAKSMLEDRYFAEPHLQNIAKKIN